jgi:serine/threonine protein kinase
MDQPTWIGRSLNGRYTITALLGSGGMSSVYKANDPNLKRVVAIKLIHPHLSTDPDFIYRFKKEASAVAAFRHPNIVQVYDFNVDGEVYYMVLEFIPGESLQERLKELKKSNLKMPIEQAIQIVINVCSAMGYAHKHGMVHRDIKPANIMLNVHGEAILMDFGIVKILGDETHTVTGAVVGTARYMSPEVIRSEVPDERSDIYSLGVTFYEMLNGDPPFNADSAMSLMMRHLNDPVPNLRNLRPDVPPQLVAIINRSLEKDRVKRYSSADEMAADLRNLLTKLADPQSADSPTMVETEGATEIERIPIPVDRNEAMTALEAPLVEPEPPLPQAKPVYYPPTSLEKAAGTDAVATGRSEVKAPEVPVPEPLPDRKQTEPAKRTSGLPVLALAGGGLFLLLLICAGAYFLGNRLLAANTPPTATPTETSAPTRTEAAAVLIANTEASTATQTLAPTITPTVTSTLPPLYVRINRITLNANNAYVVEYETFGYTEVLPGQHVHFFFDTVPVEQAGNPGNGPWQLYGGPRPFTKYRVSDRPQGATQMCALVANPDHSIIPETGNCIDLP